MSLHSLDPSCQISSRTISLCYIERALKHLVYRPSTLGGSIKTREIVHVENELPSTLDTPKKVRERGVPVSSRW